MTFYERSEEKAVMELAERVKESGGEWGGWGFEQIQNPAARKFDSGFNSFDIFAPKISGMGNPYKMNQFQIYGQFRDLLESYPAFILLGEYKPLSHALNEWDNKLVDASYEARMGVRIAESTLNHYRQGKRNSEPLKTVKIVNEENGINAEVVDARAVNPELNDPILKILYIRNPGPPSPGAVRLFLWKLYEIAMVTCGYDLTFGHPSTMEQEDRPHNSEKDQRFKIRRRVEIKYGDESHKYKISNLAQYWWLQGFDMFPSPEEPSDICVGWISENSLAKRLAGEGGEVWNQIKEINSKGRRRCPEKACSKAID